MITTISRPLSSVMVPMIIWKFQILKREKDSTYHQSKKEIYRFIQE
jgi:hypothetical protein